MEKDVEKAILNEDEEALKRFDFLTPMLVKMMRSGWYIRNDGKICKLLRRQDENDPWLHFNRKQDSNCGIYKSILYEVFGVVSRYCRNYCVKVVVYPNTLKELFEVYRVFSESDYSCKCGIDERGYGNLFGGYIYTDALYKGVDIKRDLAKKLPGLKIMVKQGCTEFGSDPKQWKTNRFLEDMVMDWVEVDNNIYTRPPYLKARIVRRWYEFARKNRAEG